MEVELKLEVGAADVEKLLGNKLFEGGSVEALTSVYFDTPAQDLRAAGFSLRVRHASDRRIQTVKADGSAAAGLFIRTEWERDIDGDMPVLDSPEQPLRQLVGSKVLTKIGPVFESRIQRSIAVKKGRDSVIELVLDRGEIVSAGRSWPVCELELELREGPQAAIFTLAHQLDRIIPVRLGVLAKSERAYRLINGNGRRATKSEPIVLTSDMTASTAFQAIAAACIRQFRLNEVVLGKSDDASALHQARVALRRLRSAFSLFKPMLGDPKLEHLRAELRWIAGVLGDARNIDVLVARFSDEGGVARLREGRASTYAQVATALASPRLRKLMLDLAEWLALGAWLTAPEGVALREQAVLKTASDLLERHRRRVKCRGSDLAKLDDEGRHALRIETKKLRYAAEFFSSLFTGKKEARRAKLFGGALTDLQHHLGDLNDLVTMPALLEELGLTKEFSLKMALAGSGKAAILKEAVNSYDHLVDTKRYWR